MITNEYIDKELQEQLNYLYSIHDDRQVLGVFTYGKVNYGFAENDLDIQTMVIYLPTFEEMCTKMPVISTYIYENKSILKIDFRLLYNLIESQDHIAMEGLFSEHYIINPRYQKAFKKYVYINKEALYHCDQKKKIEDTVARAKQCLNKYIEEKDTEALFECCRLRMASRLYLDGTSCENCINFKKDYYINYLWQIKRGELIPNLDEIRQELDDFIEEVKDFKPNMVCKELVTRACKEIMKVALTDMVQEKDFTEFLTENEKQALNTILQNINNGHEGTVSISQLTLASGISRPVFKNVLDKMKDNLIAEIENRGAKGTYVKIIDGTLLSKGGV